MHFWWGCLAAVDEFDLADDFGTGFDGEVSAEDSAGDFGGGEEAAGVGGEDVAEDAAGDLDMAGDEVALDAGGFGDGECAGGDGLGGVDVGVEGDVADVDFGEAFGAADGGEAGRGVEGVAAVDAAAFGGDGRRGVVDGGGAGALVGEDFFGGAVVYDLETVEEGGGCGSLRV